MNFLRWNQSPDIVGEGWSKIAVSTALVLYTADLDLVHGILYIVLSLLGLIFENKARNEP